MSSPNYEIGGKMASFPFVWNMESDGRISVLHNLPMDGIVLLSDRPIEITITDDTEKVFNGLGLGGGGYTIKGKEFILYRPSGGQFHGPKFRRTDIIRGHIVVLYKLL